MQHRQISIYEQRLGKATGVFKEPGGCDTDKIIEHMMEYVEKNVGNDIKTSEIIPGMDCNLAKGYFKRARNIMGCKGYIIEYTGTYRRSWHVKLDPSQAEVTRMEAIKAEIKQRQCFEPRDVCASAGVSKCIRVVTRQAIKELRKEGISYIKTVTKNNSIVYKRGTS